jgi:hypothetical protein
MHDYAQNPPQQSATSTTFILQALGPNDPASPWILQALGPKEPMPIATAREAMHHLQLLLRCRAAHTIPAATRSQRTSSWHCTARDVEPQNQTAQNPKTHPCMPRTFSLHTPAFKPH